MEVVSGLESICWRGVGLKGFSRIYPHRTTCSILPDLSGVRFPVLASRRQQEHRGAISARARHGMGNIHGEATQTSRGNGSAATTQKSVLSRVMESALKTIIPVLLTSASRCCTFSEHSGRCGVQLPAVSFLALAVCRAFSGMRRVVVFNAARRMMSATPRQNWIQGSPTRNDVLTGWNGRTSKLWRNRTFPGRSGSGGHSSNETWTAIRGMGSAKTKEQPRGSLWRTRSVISKETVQAVHDLKRSKANPVELDRVFQSRIARLLKMDLLATLSELQRQNEIELALRVFDVVRNEIWYKPDQFLYRAMIDALGRNRRIAEVEKKFQELQDEGIKPEVPIYRELVGAYVRAHMLPQALDVHTKMVEVGCGDDPLSLRFIGIGKEKEAVRIKQRRKAADKLLDQANSE